MKITRIRNLVPAPKDAEQLYLVVTPSRLSINESGDWKDGRDTVSVEVWRRKGNEAQTQEGMGDYAVYVYRNGSIAAIQKNNPSFSLQASKTDNSLEFRLIVCDNCVQTVTVDISRDGTGLASVTEYYLAAAASSGITTATSGWTTDPTATAATITATKKYLWNYEEITYTDGSVMLTTPVIIGRYGDKGVGISSVTEYYLSSSQVTGITRSTSGWTTDPTATAATLTALRKYLWNYEKITFTNGTTELTDPVIIGVYGDKGDKGDTGDTGESGVGISSVTEYYLAADASSGITTATSGWTTDPTATAATITATKKYLWNYEKITYTDGSVMSTTPVIIGRYGDKGDKGVSITSVTEYYLASASATGVTTSTSGWTTNPSAAAATITATKKYLWNYEVISYSDGTTESTYPVIIGVYGDKGDKGNGIASTTTYYLTTTMSSGVTRSTEGWTSEYRQGTPDMPFVWRYTDTLYSDGTHTYTDCELVYAYSAGSNHNLLEQTNFSSLLSMDKWVQRSLYVVQDDYTGDDPEDDPEESKVGIATGLQAHNAYYDETDYGLPTISHKEILSQAVRDSNADKLDAGTWYTLSFWYKATKTEYLFPEDAEKTQATYGFFFRTLRLTKGVEYTYYANGSVENPDEGYLLVQVGNNFTEADGTTVWEGYAIRIYSDTAETQSLTFTAQHDGLYRISAYSFKSQSVVGGNVTVNWYRIVAGDRILATYAYPSIIDTSVKGIVDGTQQSMRGDGYVAWGSSADWVRHSVTFKTKKKISDGNKYVLFRLLPGVADGLTRSVHICMPKLEVGMQATGYMSNEGSIHAAQPRRRRWALSTEYLAGGVDEPYLDAVLYQAAGETAFYRCIRSHVSDDKNKPTGTDGAEYWTNENSAFFENLSTDLFFATKAYVDNLIATMIQTGYEGSPHIEAEGAKFKIFGNGQYPAIFLAVNDDGKAVLRFQNETTGEFLYDLGPEGIMKTFNEMEDSWDEYSFHKLTDVTRVSELLNILSSMCGTYYRFSEGYKQIQTGNFTQKEYHISGTSTPSAYNSSYFEEKDYNGSNIPDGWYCKPNNGSYMLKLGMVDSVADQIYIVHIYKFINGKLVYSVPVYFRSKDPNAAFASVGCDEDGNELSRTVYPYLYSYWLSNLHT